MRKTCRPRCRRGLPNTTCGEHADNDSGAIAARSCEGKKRSGGEVGASPPPGLPASCCWMERTIDEEMIRYTRGRVTVLDRGRLEETACECYGVVKAYGLRS